MFVSVLLLHVHACICNTLNGEIVFKYNRLKSHLKVGIINELPNENCRKFCMALVLGLNFLVKCIKWDDTFRHIVSQSLCAVPMHTIDLGVLYEAVIIDAKSEHLKGITFPCDGLEDRRFC